MGGEIGATGDRFQVRLRDLAVAVLGSAFVLDVARRSMAAWGGGPPDLQHALGLAVLALAVSLALIVAGRRSRSLRAGNGPATRGARAWALVWRSAAVGWLACSVAEAAWVLQFDRAGMATSALGGLRSAARLGVVPLCTAMGMIGLILAASPCPPRPTSASPPRAAWLSAVFAGLAGLALVAIGYEAIAYLILLALDAVTNAMIRAPMTPRAPLFDRLARSGLEAAATGAACLATAAWVAEDLRRAAHDPRSARGPRSWPGVLARLATTSAAAIGGVYLLLVSHPNVHPQLAEGFATIVDPITAATIALGFAGLAAGLAAGGSARLATDGGAGPESVGSRPPSRVWTRRLVHSAGCLVAAEIIAAAVLAIRGVTERRWYAPIDLPTWIDLLRYPTGWLGSSSSWPGLSSPLDHPGDLLILLAAPWIVVRLLALIAGGTAGPPPALDEIAADRLALGRFLGWWAALTVAMLAALPAYFLGGLALWHVYLLRIAG